MSERSNGANEDNGTLFVEEYFHAGGALELCV